MEKNAIYFPYMNLPENQWFTQALIYWDQINSIVPMDYASKLSDLRPYTQDLIETGLVTPIIPGKYISRIPNFVEAFLEYIDRPDYPIPKEISKRRTLPTSDIHAQKLGDIGYELTQRGLARRVNSFGWDWYEVETFTANQFMAYLAASLGELKEIKSDPITDRPRNLASFYTDNSQNTENQSVIDELRTIVLREILPTPAEDVAPIEIIEFKDDYKKELNRFRNRIESIIIDAAAIEDIEFRDLKITQFINETNDLMDEISEAMKSKGWKDIILGGLITYAPSGAALAAAYVTQNPLAALAAALGIVSTGHKKYQESKERASILSNYAAYAVISKENL